MSEALNRLATTPRIPTGSGPENGTGPLIDLCREWLRPADVVAEVGSFGGVSTEVLAQFAGTVHAVDPWRQQYERYRDARVAAEDGQLSDEQLAAAEGRFDEMCARAGNVRKVKATSLRGAAGFAPGSLDAVYVDGDHAPRSIVDDLAAWVPKVKAGGLLMGHDFNMAHFHLKAAGFTPLKLYPDQSWVCQVKEHRPLLRLDLACGRDKRHGFVGVDAAPGADHDVLLDLAAAGRWPWADGAVDQVWCSHFLEHLTGEQRIGFVEEVWRVLKPGGYATVTCPYYTSVRAVMDPTHKFPPISECSPLYFARPWREANALGHYPIRCNFSFEFQLLCSGGVVFQSAEHRRAAHRHYFNVIDDILILMRKED